MIFKVVSVVLFLKPCQMFKSSTDVFFHVWALDFLKLFLSCYVSYFEIHKYLYNTCTLHLLICFICVINCQDV